jgi:hypothetical protein
MALATDRPEFTLIYDGEILRANRMDVREVAPALIAVGDLFHETYAVLGGTAEAPLRLDIEAFRPGSFTVRFLLDNAGHLGDDAAVLFSAGVQTLNNVLETVTKTLDIIKRLRGRDVDAALTSDGTHIRIPGLDGDMEISSSERLLLVRRSWRKAARDTLAPLEESAEEVRIEVGDKRLFVANRDDFQSFVVPVEKTEPLTVNLIEVIAHLVAPSFRRGEMWRLAFDERSPWVTIEDEHFLDQVESGQIRLGSKDVMRCRMRMEQYATEGGHTSFSYAVIEVVHFTPGERPEQQELSNLGPSSSQSEPEEE